MNQYPIMPPTQGPGLQSAAVPQNTARLTAKPGISPSVQALMNAQAQQGQLGARQPAPGARPVQPGQQLQNYSREIDTTQPAPNPAIDPTGIQMDPTGMQQASNYHAQMQDQMSQLFPENKPAPYQPPAQNPNVPATTPAPMPPMRGRDRIGMDRAQIDPGMRRRLAAFGPQVR